MNMVKAKNENHLFEERIVVKVRGMMVGGRIHECGMNRALSIIYLTT